MNLLHGRWCASVVTQRKGPAFRWKDERTGTWQQGDELPAAIANTLPGPEWQRCQHHQARRWAERRAA